MCRAPSLLLLFGLLFAPGCAAPGERAISVWSGRYVDNNLLEDLVFLNTIDAKDSYLGAVGYSQQLTHGKTARWEIEGQAVQHFGEKQTHQEFNGVFILRWLPFPWDHKLRTTMAIGEGVSYAVELPEFEDGLAKTKGKAGTAKWLNYLVLEMTFGLPKYEHFDVIARVHHRSGVFGLFNDVTEGSNFLTLGFRVTF